MDHSELLDKVYERLDSFICGVCNEKFYHRDDYMKHDHSSLIDKVFERVNRAQIADEEYKVEPVITCIVCNEKFYNDDDFTNHEHTSRGFATPLDGQVGSSISNEQIKTDIEQFDLTQIPYSALTRLGTVFLEGQAKYGKGNWKNGVGNKDWHLQRANHALKHLLLYIHELSTGESLGVEHEDNLAKVAWFCVTQMELQRLEGLQQ